MPMMGHEMVMSRNAKRITGLLSVLTCATGVLGAQGSQPPDEGAETADRIVAVFDEQPIEFDKTLVDGTIAATGDGQVRLFRNGQQIERTLPLPAFPRDLRNAQRIVATLIVEPEILEVDGKVRPADPWTRLGSVTIAVDPGSSLAPTSRPSLPVAPTTRPGVQPPRPSATQRAAAAAAATQAQSTPADSQQYPITTVVPGQTDEAEIEIMRFVTPFGGPATYTADLTAFAPLLAGSASIRVWISTWKMPAWKVTLTLSFASDGVGYRRPIFAQPIFNGEVTAEKRALHASITIPRGLSRPRLHILSTGHATDGAGGDEFISRAHVLRIDGQEVARWRPWSEQGGPLRSINPTAGRTEIDGRSLWASDLDRTGWHPGLIVQPDLIPLPELTPGQHMIELEIQGIRPKDQSGYGYWRVSAIVVADEPWPPSEDGPGPQ
jgi:hypothetical protein